MRKIKTFRAKYYILKNTLKELLHIDHKLQNNQFKSEETLFQIKILHIQFMKLTQ